MQSQKKSKKVMDDIQGRIQDVIYQKKVEEEQEEYKEATKKDFSIKEYLEQNNRLYKDLIKLLKVIEQNQKMEGELQEVEIVNPVRPHKSIKVNNLSEIKIPDPLSEISIKESSEYMGYLKGILEGLGKIYKQLSDGIIRTKNE